MPKDSGEIRLDKETVRQQLDELAVASGELPDSASLKLGDSSGDIFNDFLTNVSLLGFLVDHFEERLGKDLSSMRKAMDTLVEADRAAADGIGGGQ